MKDRAIAAVECVVYSMTVAVVIVLLFFRDPRAFIEDYREFVRDNKKLP